MIETASKAPVPLVSAVLRLPPPRFALCGREIFSVREKFSAFPSRRTVEKPAPHSGILRATQTQCDPRHLSGCAFLELYTTQFMRGVDARSAHARRVFEATSEKSRFIYTSAK